MSRHESITRRGVVWCAHLLLVFVASRMPSSDFPLLGPLARRFRYGLCRILLEECGRGVNIERGVWIGREVPVRVGDHSGLGVNLTIGRPLVVGRDVMIGMNVRMIARNHCFSRTDVPMRTQGFTMPQELRIDDDVWIGDQVIILPNVKRIGRGSIVGAGAVVTRDVPEMAIMGGNPARLIRSRVALASVGVSPVVPAAEAGSP